VKKILVTGSNGLLGQKLVQLLSLEPSIELIATARGENRLLSSPHPQSFRYISLDVSNAEMVNAIMAEVKPDTVIHTAAMTQVDDCESQRELCKSLNVDAVQYLINACEHQGSFLVHLSTDFIFDGAAGPYNEQAQPNPLSYYGESKWEAERIIQQSTIPWAIARTVLVYGVTANMSRSNIILWVKNSLEAGKTIQVVDDQWRTPTLAEDLAMGCWLIANQKAQGIFNISGKDFLTPYQMAIMTADYFGLDKSLIVKTDGSKFTQAAKRPPRTGFVIDKAVKTLGYTPHSFLEGIEIVHRQINQI
jgi:dTDP-4-dehydrorhamnose reductase